MGDGERPNPVVGTLVARDLLPFVPVWLFGVVLAAGLDYFGLVGPKLPTADLFLFAVCYTLLVGTVASLNLYRHLRSAPQAIRLGPDRLWVAPRRRSEGGALHELPFSRVRAVYLGGFFGPHLEALGDGSVGTSLPLTLENARAVASAWTSWRIRTREAAGTTA